MNDPMRAAVAGAIAGGVTISVGTAIVVSRDQYVFATVLGVAAGLVLIGAVLLSYSYSSTD